jgi:DNA-binding NarL/FixJ family response regulator
VASDQHGERSLPPGFRRRIRVAILCSSGIMRRGCAAIVDSTPHLEVAHVGDAGDTAALEEVRADFYVVGMATRSDAGARAIEELARRGGCVIAVTAPGLRPSTAIELGSHAVVDSVDDDEVGLVRAIDQIVRGEVPPPDTRSRGTAPISPREEDVLRELARGSTDREIAATLGISVRTVQSHLDRIREKTRRRRRAELTVLAFELGLAPRDGSSGE